MKVSGIIKLAIIIVICALLFAWIAQIDWFTDLNQSSEIRPELNTSNLITGNQSPELVYNAYDKNYYPENPWTKQNEVLASLQYNAVSNKNSANWSIIVNTKGLSASINASGIVSIYSPLTVGIFLFTVTYSTGSRTQTLPVKLTVHEATYEQFADQVIIGPTNSIINELSNNDYTVLSYMVNHWIADPGYNDVNVYEHLGDNNPTSRWIVEQTNDAPVKLTIVPDVIPTKTLLKISNVNRGLYTYNIIYRQAGYYDLVLPCTLNVVREDNVGIQPLEIIGAKQLKVLRNDTQSRQFSYYLANGNEAYQKTTTTTIGADQTKTVVSNDDNFATGTWTVESDQRIPLLVTPYTALSNGLITERINGKEAQTNIAISDQNHAIVSVCSRDVYYATNLFGSFTFSLTYQTENATTVFYGTIELVDAIYVGPTLAWGTWTMDGFIYNEVKSYDEKKNLKNLAIPVKANYHTNDTGHYDAWQYGNIEFILRTKHRQISGAGLVDVRQMNNVNKPSEGRKSLTNFRANSNNPLEIEPTGNTASYYACSAVGLYGIDVLIGNIFFQNRKINPIAFTFCINISK